MYVCMHVCMCSLVALCGLLLGMVLAQALGGGDDDRNVWVVFSLLLILHQYSNYRLIRVLVFESLNPQRCFILTRLEVDACCHPKVLLIYRSSGLTHMYICMYVCMYVPSSIFF